MEDLLALLREDALALEGRFRKASIEGRGTPQEIADFRENAVQEFVARFFPFPHKVTKGKIRDSFGLVSDSIDCVICNPNHPYTVDSRGKFTLLLAEGVDAAVEVKPDLGTTSELHRGLEQGLSVKALKRATSPTNMRMPWVVERAHRIPFAIFAMRCKANPIETGQEIARFYKEKATPPLQQADFVVVNGVGLFMNCVDASLYVWENEASVSDKTGWFFEEWRDNSLAGFLWRLHGVAHASIKMQDDVLPRYLVPRGVHRVVRVSE